jgi:hypothetical protein
MEKIMKPRCTVMSLLAAFLISAMIVPAFAASPATLIVDGHVTAAEPLIKDGTPYLSLDSVGQFFGKDVFWNVGQNTIYVGGGSGISDSFAGQYLALNLGITPVTGDVSVFDYLAALQSVQTKAGQEPEKFAAYARLPLTARTAVAAAFDASGLKELAGVYAVRPDSPILPVLGIASSTAFGDTLEAAIETGFLPGQYLPLLADDAALSAEKLNVLILRAADWNGISRGYIGNISDRDIIEKLNYNWNSTPIILNEELQQLGEKALIDGITTGFNIRAASYAANFLDVNALLYGHADIRHARQLIALLKAEGLDARVNLEPKTSAYEFLLEWGEPGPHTRKITDTRYATYDKEYDLRFEFIDPVQKDKFDSIIKAYAKKETNGQPNLLAGSWFQPLYASATPISGDYHEIVCLTVSFNDDYSITPYSTKEKAAEAAAYYKKTGARVASTPLYVNAAFYRYITGESSR